jgi:hypothetical protein
VIASSPTRGGGAATASVLTLSARESRDGRKDTPDALRTREKGFQLDLRLTGLRCIDAMLVERCRFDETRVR